MSGVERLRQRIARHRGLQSAIARDMDITLSAFSNKLHGRDRIQPAQMAFIINRLAQFEKRKKKR